MLRPVTPVDLASLLVLQFRALPNQARSRRVLAAGPGRTIPYGSLVREWLPRRSGSHAWILSRRGMAAGVVEVHRRLGPTCWEVSCLQAPRGATETMTELLDAACGAIADLGGHALFIRLLADSPASLAARYAQYTPYSSEELYVRQGAPPLAPALSPDVGLLRRAEEPDLHQLYRLYQAVVPAPAREAEGMTFSQWREGLDLPRGWRRQDTVVLERGGDVAGWLTIAGSQRKGIIDVLLGAEGREGAAALIAAGLQASGRNRTTLCLVPSYQHFLAGPLKAMGFEKASELVLHVRHVVARVKERELAPAGAMPR
ncbi:MAG: hypothetical protein V3V35_06700 [Dehalococcoidia bacterium]